MASLGCRGFSGHNARDRTVGQGEGALTHGNEHDDRQGVVHGVSAHSPPCQTDHLPSKGPLVLLAGEMGCGGSQLGVPSSPDPCSCRHVPSELILTVHQDHSVSGCSRPPYVSLGHIWGQKDSMFPFISNGKAAPCSFTVTDGTYPRRSHVAVGGQTYSLFCQC